MNNRIEIVTRVIKIPFYWSISLNLRDIMILYYFKEDNLSGINSYVSGISSSSRLFELSNLFPCYELFPPFETLSYSLVTWIVERELSDINFIKRLPSSSSMLLLFSVVICYPKSADSSVWIVKKASSKLLEWISGMKFGSFWMKSIR
jgi:hypothetical protein